MKSEPVGVIEKGIIEKESSESHVGAIWKASGRHLGAIWETSWSHLGAIWGLRGAIWVPSGSIWEPSGRHLGGIWEAWAPKVLPRWSEGAETQKSVTTPS